MESSGSFNPLDSFAENTLISGRYRLSSLIAQGGMGAVFKALDERTGQSVAIKILFCPYLSEEERNQVLKRFEREAQLVTKITHKNVVQVLDYAFHHDTPCLVMELIDGINLREYFNEKKRLSPEAARIIVEQICLALEAAHEHSIVHRDLKPSNILLAGDAKEGLIVKVADFGVAKAIKANNDETDLTMQGKVIGTPAYMSPEQVQGEQVDTRSDIYSLAVLTFELLTGENPFYDASFAKSMLKHVHNSTPSLQKLAPDVIGSRALDKVFKRAMAKKRENRIATVQEFREQLNRAILGRRKHRQKKNEGTSRLGRFRASKVGRFFTENLAFKIYGALLTVPVLLFLASEVDTSQLSRGLERLLNALK